MIHRRTTESALPDHWLANLTANCGTVLKQAEPVHPSRVKSGEQCRECWHINNDPMLPFASYWEDTSRQTEGEMMTTVNDPTYASVIADGYDRAVWCEKCGHYVLHRALDNDVFECAICHTKQHLRMTDREWMSQYAPHGYRYMKKRIPFDVLDMAVSPSDILSISIAHLHRKMEREIEGRFYAVVFTRVSVYPKQVGESLNHLDPLLPRLGIEIEIRQPTAAP